MIKIKITALLALWLILLHTLESAAVHSEVELFAIKHKSELKELDNIKTSQKWANYWHNIKTETQNMNPFDEQSSRFETKYSDISVKTSFSVSELTIIMCFLPKNKPKDFQWDCDIQIIRYVEVKQKENKFQFITNLESEVKRKSGCQLSPPVPLTITDALNFCFHGLKLIGVEKVTLSDIAKVCCQLLPKHKELTEKEQQNALKDIFQPHPSHIWIPLFYGDRESIYSSIGFKNIDPNYAHDLEVLKNTPLSNTELIRNEFQKLPDAQELIKENKSLYSVVQHY